MFKFNKNYWKEFKAFGIIILIFIAGFGAVTINDVILTWKGEVKRMQTGVDAVTALMNERCGYIMNFIVAVEDMEIYEQLDELMQIGERTKQLELFMEFSSDFDKLTGRNEYIEDFWLYDKKTDNILSSGGVVNSKRFFDTELTGAYSDYSEFLSLLNENKFYHFVRGRSEDGKDPVHIYQFLPLANADSATVMLGIKVNTQTFFKPIYDFADNGDNCFFLNSDGNVIAGANLNDSREIEEAEGLAKKIGRFGRMISSLSSDERYQVVAKINMGAIVWSVLKRNLLNFVLMLFFVMAAAAAATALSYGRLNRWEKIANLLGKDSGKAYHQDRIKSGIIKLTEENKAVEEKMQRYKTDARQVMFRRLLENDHCPSTSQLQEMDIIFPYNYFFVMLVDIEDCRDAELRDDSSYLKYAISNMIAELFGDEGLYIAGMADSQIIFIKNTASVLDEQRETELSQIFIDAAQNGLDTTISVCFGTVCSSIEGIKESYHNALKAKRYKMFGQNGQTVIYSREMEGTFEPLIDEALVNRLRRSVDIGDTNVIDSVLDDILDRFYNKNINIRFAESIYNEIVNTVVRLINEIDKDKIITADEIKKMFEETDIRSRIANIKEVLHTLCDLSVQNREHQKNDNIAKLTNDIVRYMQNNYFDPNISLKSVADEFGLSPSYLSRFFTENINEKFVNYLRKLRIEEAKRLLRETELNISEIALRVGYMSSVVLIRNFKKTVGISPTEYRNME